jgi:AcrR family transcriptional regulator
VLLSVSKMRARQPRAKASDRLQSRAIPALKTPLRRARGLKTRQTILRKAVDLASLEGLEGLTIGKLASELRIS